MQQSGTAPAAAHTLRDNRFTKGEATVTEGMWRWIWHLCKLAYNSASRRFGRSTPETLIAPSPKKISKRRTSEGNAGLIELSYGISGAEQRDLGSASTGK